MTTTSAAANINRAAGAANPLARDTTFIEHGHCSPPMHISAVATPPMRYRQRADTREDGDADDESDYDLHFSNSNSRTRSCTRIMAQQRREDEANKGALPTHKGRYPALNKSLLREKDRAQTVPRPHALGGAPPQRRKHHMARSVGNVEEEQDELTDREDVDAGVSVYMAPASPMLAAAGPKSPVRRLDFDGATDSAAMVMATPNVGPRESPRAHNDVSFDLCMAPRSPSPQPQPRPTMHPHVQTHNSRAAHSVYYSRHDHEPYVHFPNNSHGYARHTHAGAGTGDWPRDMSPLSDLSVLACATSRYHNEPFAHDEDSFVSQPHSRGGGLPPPLIDDNAHSFYESEFRQMASQHRRMYVDEDRVCVGNPGHGGFHSALEATHSDTYCFESDVQNENEPPALVSSASSRPNSSKVFFASGEQHEKRRPLRRTSSKKQRNSARKGKYKGKGRKHKGKRRGLKSSHARKRRTQQEQEIVVPASDAPPSFVSQTYTETERRPMLDTSSKNSSCSPSRDVGHARKSWWRKLFHRVLCVGVMCQPLKEKENCPPEVSSAASPEKSVHAASTAKPKPTTAVFTPSHDGSHIDSSRPFTPSFDNNGSPMPFAAAAASTLSHHRRHSSLSQLKPFPEFKFPRCTPNDLQAAPYPTMRPLTPEHESRSFYTYGEHHVAFDTPQRPPTYSPPPLLRPTPIHARVRSHPPANRPPPTNSATRSNQSGSPIARVFAHDVSHHRTRTPEPRTDPLAELPSPIRWSGGEGPDVSDFPTLSECGSDLPLPLTHKLISPVVHFRTPAVVRVGGPSMVSLLDNRGSMTAPRPIRPTPIRPQAIPFDAFAMSDTEPESAEEGSMVSDLEHYVETHPGGFDESAEPTPNMPTRGGAAEHAHLDSSNNLREIDEFLGCVLPPAAPSFGSIDTLNLGGLAPPAAPDAMARLSMRTPPHMAMRAIQPEEEFFGVLSLDRTLCEFGDHQAADNRTSLARTHRLSSDQCENGSEPKRSKRGHLEADEVPAAVSQSAPPTRYEVLGG